VLTDRFIKLRFFVVGWVLQHPLEWFGDSLFQPDQGICNKKILAIERVVIPATKKNT
jgi:hypothetical protein